MRALVVFDSLYGNTERIARAIGGSLAAGSEVVVLPVREASPLAADDPDLLVLGSPTQRRSVTPAVRDLLAALPRESLQHLPAAAFGTRSRLPGLLSGSASNVIAAHLQRKGCRLVVAPESFIVEGTDGPLADGELERAEAWGSALLDRLRLERLRARR